MPGAGCRDGLVSRHARPPAPGTRHPAPGTQGVIQMKANYGYKDGAGDFFITVDTDRCDGCGKCVPACLAKVMEAGEDENDPLNENKVAKVSGLQRKKLKYACAPCKPDHDRKKEPCKAACPKDALEHSW